MDAATRGLLAALVLASAPRCATVASVAAPASYVTGKQSADTTATAAHRFPAKTVGLVLIGAAGVTGLVAYILSTQPEHHVPSIAVCQGSDTAPECWIP